MASSMRYPELNESERFPILTARGRELLYRMRQHPMAPIWNWPNGEQLDSAGLERVKEFAASLSISSTYSAGLLPDWLSQYVDRCLREVPYFRTKYGQGRAFEEIPPICRANLAPRVWDFVPDDEPLDDVIVFSSSGTTGYPTRTAHHPVSAACGVPLMEFALRSLHGITLQRGTDHVAITNIAAYRGAYTTAIVVAYLEEAGCIRVNLHPSAWRSESHRHQFINHWKAPIWLGDPIAYSAMEKLDWDHQPKAILSSIMHITDAYAKQLETRFACPVLDLYAMTEAGIIAVRTAHGHRVLSPDLYVEILDPQGNVCAEGVRGEITLTGGRNPYLPLLRYRTGDFASLQTIEGHRVLVGLEGRQSVEYVTRSGRIVHSMEVTRVMRHYPVIRYELVELGNREYELRYAGDIDAAALANELSEIFGQKVIVSLHFSKESP
jgi:phenylacetate-CoA ligase